MLAASIEAQPDRWAVLQNHPRSSNPDDDTFYALLAALDAGWRVEPPVYVRPRWGSEHAGTVMYHFILRRETGTTMVSVPTARASARFAGTRPGSQRAKALVC